MWQAVRASSAAPGYFQEFPLQSDIHQVVIHKTADVNSGDAERFKGEKKHRGASEQMKLSCTQKNVRKTDKDRK